MNTIKLALMSAILMLLASAVMAAGELGTEQIRQLLSGNSVEEKNLEWGYVRKLYFQPDGKFLRIDQNGNKSSGSWGFQREGELCIDSVKRHCWELKPTDDKNTYNVHSRKSGLLKKTFKVIPGDAYKF